MFFVVAVILVDTLFFGVFGQLILIRLSLSLYGGVGLLDSITKVELVLCI